MLREQAAAQGHEPDFRWRGREVARVEGLCDGVFAFAVTLLVVSLEVPHSYSDLMLAMHGFVGFALSFALLFQLWHSHHRFFRRYGLQDVTTHLLTGALLFMVLFFTYPLKFLFGFLQAVIFHDDTAPAITLDQMRNLMLVYGAGFVAVFLVMMLLHVHAWRQREQLELDGHERLLTLQSLRANGLMVLVGLISLGVASVSAGLAGMVYFLCPLVQTANGYWTNWQQKKLRESLNAVR